MQIFCPQLWISVAEPIAESSDQEKSEREAWRLANIPKEAH